MVVQSLLQICIMCCQMKPYTISKRMLVRIFFSTLVLVNLSQYLSKHFNIEISSISSNSGSVLGGTVLTINGPFLYTDSKVPADIKIAGYLFCSQSYPCLYIYIYKLMNHSKIKANLAAFWTFLLEPIQILQQA